MAPQLPRRLARRLGLVERDVDAVAGLEPVGARARAHRGHLSSCLSDQVPHDLVDHQIELHRLAQSEVGLLLARQHLDQRVEHDLARQRPPQRRATLRMHEAQRLVGLDHDLARTAGGRLGEQAGEQTHV
ncbi:hypothetical protein OV079_12320 [Nannocystis pusilla]|uniref:Uncharacterized protein n=1 Tax=Nannocystis pusilla TaxID=889268 RepID=A0A9X3EMC1_9BACT|nr:hypothetical protein [Nannocystis pusilla]MCY1006331.1 hypothetical protein [Nannocystis pusilla]